MTEYTLHSRMRRAMTWVYCDPKSRMTICSIMTQPETHCLPVTRAFGEKKVKRFDPRRRFMRGGDGSSPGSLEFLCQLTGDEPSPPRIASVVGDAVGQFVPIVRSPRKMLRQQRAGRLDAVKDAARELGFAEVFGHRPGEFRPESVAAFFMDARVTDHREFVGSRSQEDH